MSNVAIKTPIATGRFLLRVLIGLVLVFGLIVLSAGGRIDLVLAYLTHAGGHLHAPDLSRVADASPAIKIHMAAALIAALPTLVVYFVSGRWFLRGLTAGAIKA